MKKMTVIFFVLLIELTAKAASMGNYGLTDFAAPAVNNTSSLVDVQLGQIVYDRNTQAFRGLDFVSGSWVNLSAPSGASTVSTSGSNEKIERALIDNTGTCSIISQSGTWLSSASHPGTGQCSFTMSGFSGVPSCTCVVSKTGSGSSASNTTCNTYNPAPTSTTITFSTLNMGSSGTFSDYGFAVICMGPK